MSAMCGLFGFTSNRRSRRSPRRTRRNTPRQSPRRTRRGTPRRSGDFHRTPHTPRHSGDFTRPRAALGNPRAPVRSQSFPARIRPPPVVVPPPPHVRRRSPPPVLQPGHCGPECLSDCTKHGRRPGYYLRNRNADVLSPSPSPSPSPMRARQASREAQLRNPQLSSTSDALYLSSISGSRSSSTHNGSMFSGLTLDSLASRLRRRKVGLGVQGGSMASGGPLAGGGGARPRHVVLDAERICGKGYDTGRLKTALDYYRSQGVHAVALAPTNRRGCRALRRLGAVCTPPGTVYEHYIMDYALRQRADVVSNHNFADVARLQRGADAQADMRAYLGAHQVPYVFVGSKFMPNPNPLRLGTGVHSPKRKLLPTRPLKRSRSARTI